MPAIGILGGMGPQASVRLHELLITNSSKFTDTSVDTNFPEIVMLSVPIPNFISNKQNFAIAKAMLTQRLSLLEQAQSIINGIACNTAHLMLPDLQRATSVPFVSLPKLIAEHIESNQFSRVGLLASPTTLRSRLFDESINKTVTIIRPPTQLAATTEQLIYKQIHGSITAVERRKFKERVSRFMAANKLDAVILGCTELPLVFGPTHDDKIIDSLQILADGLLTKFFEGKM